MGLPVSSNVLLTSQLCVIRDLLPIPNTSLYSHNMTRRLFNPKIPSTVLQQCRNITRNHARFDVRKGGITITVFCNTTPCSLIGGLSTLRNNLLLASSGKGAKRQQLPPIPLYLSFKVHGVTSRMTVILIFQHMCLQRIKMQITTWIIKDTVIK
jgi:hypothetical protein